jgi:HSP20 family molecular chaperone IbpA
MERMSWQVDVDGDVIRISTEYNKETQDESPEDTDPSCRWHRVERVSEYATRALRMPEQADLSTIYASMDGGVLIVKVPKKIAAISKARRVAIA